jgi:hypothetical protein
MIFEEEIRKNWVKQANKDEGKYLKILNCLQPEEKMCLFD